MRLLLTCKETTRLVLEGEDRALLLGERVLIRVHLGLCEGCTRFSKQVHLMHSAMDSWRRGTSQNPHDNALPRSPGA